MTKDTMTEEEPMATDEERREAARELRGYGFDVLKDGSLLRTLKDVTGGGSWRDCLIALADLIEPQERTCTNVRTRFAEAGFECSECHFTAEELRGWRKWTFCPGCRARIMEVSE